MNKQNYDVYRRCVVDSFYERREGAWQHMGNTFATSPKKAIANIKYRLGQARTRMYEVGSDGSMTYEWDAELSKKQKARV